MALESETPSYDYEKRQETECRNSTIYCIASIALYVITITLNNPAVASTIPGGALTLAITSIVVFIAVIALCVWQMPRRSR